MRLATVKQKSDVNGNAIAVITKSDRQNSNNPLILSDIPWGDSKTNEIKNLYSKNETRVLTPLEVESTSLGSSGQQGVA